MTRFAFLLLLLISILTAQENELISSKKTLLLMGSRFEITALAGDSGQASLAVDAAIDEIRRIEKLISSWDPQSQTSAVNREAGITPVKVDRELFELIRRSKKISLLTGGVFDISYASMDRIWKFDGSMSAMPTADEIKSSVALIGFENIILNEAETTVFLSRPGMKIGFGAIGKGYAANRAKKIMVQMGIENGVVNAGGDLIAWGRQANGKDWGIAITDPKDKNKMIGWLRSSDLAVVTSGNYEKFVEFDGVRYTHIINPVTGMPASGTRSVTIICPDAELADALATSVFILGPQTGLQLINRLKNTECLIVTDDDEMITSQHLQLQPVIVQTN